MRLALLWLTSAAALHYTPQRDGNLRRRTVIHAMPSQPLQPLTRRHLLRTAAAVRLMGAECVISGISPRIAQTMVQLGVDVGEVVTSGSIQNALTYAFRKVGVRIAAEETPKGSRV